MKIAIITDIHHGRQLNTKRGDRAIDLLQGVVDGLRRDRHDIVLELGDRITDRDTETDLGLMREVADSAVQRKLDGIDEARFPRPIRAVDNIGLRCQFE